MEKGVDFFLLSNLMTQSTGLPFCVWISSWDPSRNDVSVFGFSRTLKAVPSEMVLVSIRPDVRVIEGKMTVSDLALLRKWIELNRDVLIRHWEGDLDSKGVIDTIYPINR
jgi:hypothetical protein